MTMGKLYGILGAGMQGSAAAYDCALFGDAAQVRLADISLDVATQQANRLNRLLGKRVVTPHGIDVSDCEQLTQFLMPLDGVLSAVPYFFNIEITQAAIFAKTNMVDLGGNTDVVWEQHRLDKDAKQSGIAIVPDCGLMPGFGNLFAVYALEQMDEVYDVKIRCGGLPQKSKPPLDYKLVFSIEGLTNEYFGKAYRLKDGNIDVIDTFSDLEEIEFDDPVGRCEAFTTSGGTSTCPWSFQGKIVNYDYKTVRYPGHYQKIKTVLELGLLDKEPVKVGKTYVSPRDLFHAVVQPKITFPEDKDLVVLRAVCEGKKDGRKEGLTLETIDFFDESTGFSSMERTTGFSAALVLQMLLHQTKRRGVCRLEQSFPAGRYIQELQKRGIRTHIKNN